MTETMQRAVVDVLAYLMSLSQDPVLPAEAQRGLRLVQTQHPELALELVWEVEAYDQSLHYDVLVQSAAGDTVSVSHCAGGGGLPWPLRGVRRWSDANLLQVDGKMLTMEEAVGFLDILWSEAPIMERMVNACLIREELVRRPIEIGDAELQSGMDDLRRAKQLYTAADTERWMHERGMTHAQVEQLVAGTLMCAALRRRLAEGRVASYFEAHHAELDTAHVATIESGDEDAARRLHREIASGDVAFLVAAQQQFLATTQPARALFTTLRRRTATDALGQAVFAAAPGDVVGPVRIGARYVIAQVLAVRPAQPDEASRAEIEQILFDAWLAERRQTAKVTWHWGAARPDAA